VPNAAPASAFDAPETSSPLAPKRIARIRDALSLETTALTAAFWTAVSLFTIAFWITPFPPLIDYPQHVAAGALLRRMADPASVERQIYDVNLITYNGGFHLLVAALSFFVRPETAGRLLLSVYPPALAYASLALMRAGSRPRWYALFVLPITFSFAVGWGFANYFLSVPFVLLTFALWLRARKGERGLLWKVMLASFALSYTHVLATLCLCVMIGVEGLRSMGAAGPSLRARAIHLLELPIAVWPAVVWSVTVFVHNRYSPHANWEGWDDGFDDPLWYKLLHGTAYAVGNFADHTDQALLVLTMSVLFLVYRWPGSRTSAEPAMKLLAIVWALLYCVVPKVFIATWFIFERFPTFVLVFAVAAAPIILGTSRPEGRLRAAAAALALLAGLNTMVHFRMIPDEADANAIIDDIPEGKRVIAVTWSTTGQSVILREMWVHLLAYYQARRPGLIAYSFAKFESMPVHYSVGKMPPQIPGGMEWDANKYDPLQPYARYWDTVLVRTPDDDPASDPRVRTFGFAAAGMKVLSHRGRFWLYDAAGLRAMSAAKPETRQKQSFEQDREGS
jgi:hypothetical protein